MTSTTKTKCAVCSFMNRPGILACENCGSLLSSNSRSRQATRDLRSEENREPRSSEEDPLASTDDLNPTAYKDGMGVYLTVNNSEKPIYITPEQLQSQVVIGRRDPITQQSPPVDLDEHAGYHQGVSRKHAAFQIINGALTINDLGSANGTYLNGAALKMRQPEVISHDDVLKIGQVTVVVHFAVSKQS
jgi:pSer/pThr/pTyr-binding forkhead associated (FHA) protein